MDNKETVEDFLARGGKIETVPYGKLTYDDGRFLRERATGLTKKVLRIISKKPLQ